MQWLGDYKEDDTLYFLWSTNDVSGASITRAVDGTVQVYKDNNAATESVAGVIDVEDFDGLVGIHSCTIDLSADAFYAVGSDYAVVLKAATIDGQTVNAVLAHFSIENRYKGEVGADSKFLISTDAQDLSASLDVNAKLIEGADPTDTIRDSVLDDATRFSGAEIAAILADVTGIAGAAMRGTDNAALAVTALSTAQWTNLRAGYLDNINQAGLLQLTAVRAAFLDNINNANLATIPNIAALTLTGANINAHIKVEDNIDFGALKKASINTEVDTGLSDIDLDHFIKLTAGVANPAIGSYLDQILNKGVAQTFAQATDSLEAIRDRGDVAWLTGGVAVTDILNVQPMIPISIDLADTVTVRIGLGLTNMLGDLPTPAEITPGTITIDRKRYGGTSWTTIVNAVACSEAAGIVYYDEVFDSASGYAIGDTIRIAFKNQKITVAAVDYEITGTDGWIFHTHIREPPKVKVSKGEWAQSRV